MRITGWESLLAKFIREAADKAFIWGQNDCCLFAADAIKLMTNKDLMEEFRGLYDSEETALQALATVGKGDLHQTIATNAALAGFREIKLDRAQRGDLCCIEVNGVPGTGVIDMTARHVIGLGPRGLITVPLKAVKRVWRVE